MLPKLNDQPKYDFIIPSTGETVRFRPYLVREEKVLLTAFSTKDKKAGIKAMADTVMACATDPLDAKDLTLYDLQYLFSKIRAKSVGENVNLEMPCRKCETNNPVVVDIDDIKFETQQVRESLVKLTDDVSIKLKYPDYMTIVNNEVLTKEEVSETEKQIELAVESIKEVLTPDTRINMEDESIESRRDFVESMSPEQFNQVNDFINSEPELSFSLDFKCSECGEDNHYEVRNIEDFF